MSGIPEWIRKAMSKRIAVHESYQNVFSGPDGERVLAHIMKEGCILKTTFVSGDPHQTSLNEGKRILALSILKFVHRDHNNVIKQVERQLTQLEKEI